MNTSDMGGLLEVEKKVFDGENWVDSINADLGDTVQFKITVTYYNQTPGEHYAYNIFVNDILPPCLEYVQGSADPFEPVVTDNVLTWELDDVVLHDGESFVITFNATVVDCGENINDAFAEADEYCTGLHLEDKDSATVNVECEPPSIDVEKYVWDGYCEWVDEIHVYPETSVRFRIVVNNTGGQVLTNVTVVDTLSDSLSYDDQATVNGEPWEPDVNGSTLTWVFESLDIGEVLIIEFNAIVVGLPCEEDVNHVTVTGEGYCSEIVSDEDNAKVLINGMCMEKEVWNDEVHGWMEETTVGEGEEVTFRITVWYYGPYKLYDIKIWDVLPSCLDYADDATVNGVPYEPEISSDGKTLWWNLSSDYVLHDGESLVIKFKAFASENNCQPCINWAYIVAKECSGQILEWQDPATVYVECAFVADAGGPYYGDIGEEITITGSATGGSPPYSYAWDMDDDGQYDDASGETVVWSWDEDGDYVINLQVTDDEGEKAYDYAYVHIEPPANNPPDKAGKPSGPTSGKPGVEYTYTTVATDPDGDSVMVKFDWGDGSDSGWIGPLPSGSTFTAKHTYTAAGDYKIKARAQDYPYLELGPWSDPLTVSITKTRGLFKNTLLLELFNKLLERFLILKFLVS